MGQTLQVPETHVVALASGTVLGGHVLQLSTQPPAQKVPAGHATHLAVAVLQYMPAVVHCCCALLAPIIIRNKSKENGI
jgi:hypothetical protein